MSGNNTDLHITRGLIASLPYTLVKAESDRHAVLDKEVSVIHAHGDTTGWLVWLRFERKNGAGIEAEIMSFITQFLRTPIHRPWQ